VNTIIIYFFLSSIHYAYAVWSWENLAQLFSSIGELIIFDLTILCLIYSESKAVSFILSGFVTLISGDFIIDYSFLSQTTMMGSSGELLWFLGIILIFSGLLLLKNSTNTSNWLRKSNAIKSKLAFWAFGISLINVLPLFALSYFILPMDKELFLILPPFVMITAVVVVIISIFTGKNFEKPFEKIANNIESLMFEKDKSKIDSDFSIEEFGFLQKFITNTYSLIEERDHAKKQLGEISAQVAHDIRSPLAALNTCLKMLPQIPEEQRILMRNAANRINDIANNLLLQYKGKQTYTKSYKILLLAPLIESIISEKRLALEGRQIMIEARITSEGFAAFAEFDANEMKRILSNLINNSLEASTLLNTEAKITILLDAKNKYIILKVIDNGIGIPEKLLVTVLEPGISLKDKGHGLGLPHAKKTIENWRGELTLSSVEGQGTEVSITLPRAKAPVWFVSKIKVSNNIEIGILDDDQSVHNAWDQRLLAVSNSLKIHHFRNSSGFMAWVQAQTQPVQVFSDYELLGEVLTGLEVLEKLSLGKNAILVTSHYEDPSIIERCQKQGIRLLPKNLLAHIPIAQAEPENMRCAVHRYDAVLLDDNVDVTETWELNAIARGKTILVFNEIKAFEEALSNIDTSSPLYIDSELGSDMKGEEYAKNLFERGYHEIYLATGHDASNFKPMPWIKAIISKEPPF
jgi:signal transduction histidine kinase